DAPDDAHAASVTASAATADTIDPSPSRPPVLKAEAGPHRAALRAAPGALCDDPDPPRWIEISPSALDSINLAFSRYNLRVVGRADSMLRSGAYGDPRSQAARDQALLYLQLHCRNAMETIFDLAN